MQIGLYNKGSYSQWMETHPLLLTPSLNQCVSWNNQRYTAVGPTDVEKKQLVIW